MNERLLQTFDNLTVGHIYSRAELNIMLAENGMSGNIAGISANRWNRGMTTANFHSILFEFIEKGQYRYIGPNHTYTGPTYWYGYGNNPIGLIGKWRDGVFEFSIDGINNFDEWIRLRFPYIKL